MPKAAMWCRNLNALRICLDAGSEDCWFWPSLGSAGTGEANLTDFHRRTESNDAARYLVQVSHSNNSQNPCQKIFVPCRSSAVRSVRLLHASALRRGVDVTTSKPGDGKTYVPAACGRLRFQRRCAFACRFPKRGDRVTVHCERALRLSSHRHSLFHADEGKLDSGKVFDSSRKRGMSPLTGFVLPWTHRNERLQANRSSSRSASAKWYSDLLRRLRMLLIRVYLATDSRLGRGRGQAVCGPARHPQVLTGLCIR